LGERAHPDTRPAVWGASPHGRAVDQGDGRNLRTIECRSFSRRCLELGTHASEAQSDPPTAEPSRVAVDKKQITVDGEKKWLYAAVDTESKLLLEVDVFSRRGIGPAAAFLHRLTEKHDVADTESLVDAAGYLTALAHRELSGQLNYRERNHIEKWFHTVTMRIDRFHSLWRGSQSSAKQWLRRFRYHYNHERPNQALDGRTPAEEIQK